MRNFIHRLVMNKAFSPTNRIQTWLIAMAIGVAIGSIARCFTTNMGESYNSLAFSNLCGWVGVALLYSKLVNKE